MGTRSCSICQKPGHDWRTCPTRSYDFYCGDPKANAAKFLDSVGLTKARVLAVRKELERGA